MDSVPIHAWVAPERVEDAGDVRCSAEVDTERLLLHPGLIAQVMPAANMADPHIHSGVQDGRRGGTIAGYREQHRLEAFGSNPPDKIELDVMVAPNVGGGVGGG